MKTIKLFVKFAFTSLSPDAQPISLGITSNNDKTFYAEFTDFDINRCDEWVKDNVVSKLKLVDKPNQSMFYGIEDNSWDVKGDLNLIKSELKSFLLQFHSCDIQFVVDCSYLSSMWIIDLLDQRKKECIEDLTGDAAFDVEQEKGVGVSCMGDFELSIKYKQGLPILPRNICPIVEDLNTLIAYSEGISVKDAFNISRQQLSQNTMALPLSYSEQCCNASFDARVIKTIYNNLTR